LHILLTKADKLAFGAAKTALLKVRQEIHKQWGEAISIQLFSAPKRMGVEEAQMVLAGWLDLLPVEGEENAEEA
ncbi:YihA family ribosome biogenesis GTP-binding protein, partial [Pseudomonas sp. OA3]|nr:YihA family ribosome biogenesis GTP-binding protein [Pseudomonas sp. OA3]